jgi:hypothetical protein
MARMGELAWNMDTIRKGYAVVDDSASMLSESDGFVHLGTMGPDAWIAISLPTP